MLFLKFHKCGRLQAVFYLYAFRTLKHFKHTNYVVANFPPNLNKIKVESVHGRDNEKAILKENKTNH